MENIFGDYKKGLLSQKDSRSSGNWRFLELTAPIREIFATEEALLDSVQDGPILMIYRSKPHSISISDNQSLDEIDIDKCTLLGADWSRRISGGRAVYHNYLTDFSYSIIAPAESFMQKDNVNGSGVTPNTTKAYKEMFEVIGRAMKYIGIPITIDNNFILADGKKISGSAQYWNIKKGAFIQHGYILHEKPSLMTGYQMIKAQKSAEERARHALDMSTAITEYVKWSFSDVVNAFLETTPCQKMFLKNYERKRIQELLENKYNNMDWQTRKDSKTMTKGDCIRSDHRGIGAVIE